MSHHTAPTLTVLVQKYTPCQDVVWSQYRYWLPGTFYVPLAFGVVFFAKVCFFFPAQFCRYVDFTLALLILHTNFKLQYLMSYSSGFNNFCRFWLLAVCTTLLWWLEGQKFGDPIFVALFVNLKHKQCFHENIINNDTNHKN